MRLRSVEVKNWTCIEALSLADLRDGIIVLHGPNRTGKSSLVQAIRSCLFDHDHDSQKNVILDAIPRLSKNAPHVAVEFDHANERYRISKTFAKTKEGQACLEKQGPTGWTVLARGKDAGKKVRALIGVESSAAGVFQMLWLGQQDFRLPAPRDVDTTLAKSLESVLGTLITARDIDFKERLDAACERWYTVKTMKDRKDSPLTRQTDDLDRAAQNLNAIHRQWTEAESALRQYEEALARQPELQRNCQEAEAELLRVQKECEEVRQRKAQFDLARKNHAQSEKLLRQAQELLNASEEAVRQLTSATKELHDLQPELRARQEGRANAEQAVAMERQVAEQAELKLAEHQQGRAELEDRQRLVSNQIEQQALAEKIRQAESLDQQRQELEQKLIGPAVLSETQIHDLRQKRERAAALRANLEAGEIHVHVTALAPLAGQIACDSAPAGPITLTGAEQGRWLVRQRAELQIGTLVTVRIARGKDDRNLETIAQELADLERALGETLTGAQLDPSDASAIDQLVARRLHYVEYAKQLKRLREEVADSAPNGIPALHAQLQQRRDDQQTILTRRPDLRTWTPNPAAMDRLRSEFDDREGELKAVVAATKQAQDKANESLRTATQAEQSTRERIAAQEVQVRSLHERVGQQDSAALTHDRDDAKGRLADALRQVQDSTLSEADQTLEMHFQGVRSAHAKRSARLRENEDALLRLQTQLAGTEGLHQKRIHAEQAVNDLTRELKRETLYAQAHKHLKELFEQVRNEQVRRTVGPINDRVMNWAQVLGLGDYSGLAFGDQLLPGGLALDGESVEMARESFGTQEQLSILIRLAVGGLLATKDPAVAILDDPLAHADPGKHRRMLDIFSRAARGEPHGPHPTGPLQLIILTCHADRFDYLADAQQIDLARLMRRSG